MSPAITHADEFESGLPLTFEMKVSSDALATVTLEARMRFTDTDGKSTTLVVEAGSFADCLVEMRNSVYKQRQQRAARSGQ